MKFKGVFTHRGASMLERAFLPTVEKFGRSCQLLITPEQFCLVQTSLNTSEGAHVCARINTVSEAAGGGNAHNKTRSVHLFLLRVCVCEKAYLIKKHPRPPCARRAQKHPYESPSLPIR